MEQFWGASVMYSVEEKKMGKDDRANLSIENYVN